MINEVDEDGTAGARSGPGVAALTFFSCAQATATLTFPSF